MLLPCNASLAYESAAVTASGVGSLQEGQVLLRDFRIKSPPPSTAIALWTCINDMAVQEACNRLTANDKCSTVCCISIIRPC
jgi:hypothetical protein